MASEINNAVKRALSKEEEEVHKKLGDAVRVQAARILNSVMTGGGAIIITLRPDEETGDGVRMYMEYLGNHLAQAKIYELAHQYIEAKLNEAPEAPEVKSPIVLN